jgi:hypothetical protein
VSNWRRHNWRSRTVRIVDLGLVVPCECRWWKRLWYLLTEWVGAAQAQKEDR